MPTDRERAEDVAYCPADMIERALLDARADERRKAGEAVRSCDAALEQAISAFAWLPPDTGAVRRRVAEAIGILRSAREQARAYLDACATEATHD